MKPMIILLDPNSPVDIEDFKRYINEAYDSGYGDGLEQAQRNANSFNNGVRYATSQQVQQEG